MTLSEHYSATLIDHFEHPRNAGAMADANAEGYVVNPVCGDSLRLFLRIEDGRIERASFLTSGCPASIATSSAATELIAGLTIEEAAALPRERFAEAVGGLPSSKVHCSVLAAQAIRIAGDGWRASQAGQA
ncbi:MAG: iron-sulfur cluster assembly scaffold protein [Dehalococcoidia bacterium]|nr:iron-sulfur cluster assembly scaffold protein [Dehalococcoidia bacterium]